MGLTALQTGTWSVCALGQAPSTWARGASPAPSPQVRQFCQHQVPPTRPHPPATAQPRRQHLSLVGSWPERRGDHWDAPVCALWILTTMHSARRERLETHRNNQPGKEGIGTFSSFACQWPVRPQVEAFLMLMGSRTSRGLFVRAKARGRGKAAGLWLQELPPLREAGGSR